MCTPFCFSVNKEKIAEALQIFEILGIETNFEKMITISLKKMRAQSEDMIRDLIENEWIVTLPYLHWVPQLWQTSVRERPGKSRTNELCTVSSPPLYRGDCFLHVNMASPGLQRQRNKDVEWTILMFLISSNKGWKEVATVLLPFHCERDKCTNHI